jgi:hypothetical protein
MLRRDGRRTSTGRPHVTLMREDAPGRQQFLHEALNALPGLRQAAPDQQRLPATVERLHFPPPSRTLRASLLQGSNTTTGNITLGLPTCCALNDLLRTQAEGIDRRIPLDLRGIHIRKQASVWDVVLLGRPPWLHD